MALASRLQDRHRWRDLSIGRGIAIDEQAIPFTGMHRSSEEFSRVKKAVLAAWEEDPVLAIPIYALFLRSRKAEELAQASSRLPLAEQFGRGRLTLWEQECRRVAVLQIFQGMRRFVVCEESTSRSLAVLCRQEGSRRHRLWQREHTVWYSLHRSHLHVMWSVALTSAQKEEWVGRQNVIREEERRWFVEGALFMHTAELTLALRQGAWKGTLLKENCHRLCITLCESAEANDLLRMHQTIQSINMTAKLRAQRSVVRGTERSRREFIYSMRPIRPQSQQSPPSPGSDRNSEDGLEEIMGAVRRTHGEKVIREEALQRNQIVLHREALIASHDLFFLHATVVMATVEVFSRDVMEVDAFRVLALYFAMEGVVRGEMEERCALHNRIEYECRWLYVEVLAAEEEMWRHALMATQSQEGLVLYALIEARRKLIQEEEHGFHLCCTLRAGALHRTHLMEATWTAKTCHYHVAMREGMCLIESWLRTLRWHEATLDLSLMYLEEEERRKIVSAANERWKGLCAKLFYDLTRSRRTLQLQELECREDMVRWLVEGQGETTVACLRLESTATRIAHAIFVEELIGAICDLREPESRATLVLHESRAFYLLMQYVERIRHWICFQTRRYSLVLHVSFSFTVRSYEVVALKHFRTQHCSEEEIARRNLLDTFRVGYDQVVQDEARRQSIRDREQMIRKHTIEGAWWEGLRGLLMDVEEIGRDHMIRLAAQLKPFNIQFGVTTVCRDDYAVRLAQCVEEESMAREALPYRLSPLLWDMLQTTERILLCDEYRTQQRSTYYEYLNMMCHIVLQAEAAQRHLLGIESDATTHLNFLAFESFCREAIELTYSHILDRALKERCHIDRENKRRMVIVSQELACRGYITALELETRSGTVATEAIKRRRPR